MVVGGTEYLDRTYVESLGGKPGTNGMVQPLGQSLEFGQSESGDAGGYTKWRQCRGGWANHGTNPSKKDTNQGEPDKRAGMLARRTTPRPVPSTTSTQGLDTKAWNKRAAPIRSADGEF